MVVFDPQTIHLRTAKKCIFDIFGLFSQQEIRTAERYSQIAIVGPLTTLIIHVGYSRVSHMFIPG